MRRKFDGSFGALVREGATYINPQRFKPLAKKGKPLWEFKEFDHRLYCFRSVLADGSVEIVLFGGWIKDKKGRTDEEDREIAKAQDLLEEFLQERTGRTPPRRSQQ